MKISGILFLQCPTAESIIFMDNVTPLFFVDEPVRIDRRLISENHMTRATEAYVPGSLSEHAAIREKVKRRILLAAGLRPGMDMPEIKSEVSGGNSYHGVRIKSVRLRTAPAVELTGSLFLPENVSAPLPGILSPHGHWEHGRMQHDNRVSVIMRCWQLSIISVSQLPFLYSPQEIMGSQSHWLCRSPLMHSAHS